MAFQHCSEKKWNEAKFKQTKELVVPGDESPLNSDNEKERKRKSFFAEEGCAFAVEETGVAFADTAVHDSEEEEKEEKGGFSNVWK